MLTVLAPLQRYWREHKQDQRQDKTLTDWGRQGLVQTARWLPRRHILGVADASFAAIDLLNEVRPWITMITRLRLDAALHKPLPPRRPGTVGRPPVIGKRLPSLKQRLASRRTRWQPLLGRGWYGRGERLLAIVAATAVWNHPGPCVPIRYVLVRDPPGEREPQAVLCTALDAAPLDLLRWFVRRWSIAVTFAEVRRQLGVETQRQSSDPAIDRTTPVLRGLFSLITLWADGASAGYGPSAPTAGWYRQSLPTFSDALATVRQRIWSGGNARRSRSDRDVDNTSAAMLNTLIDIAGYAA